MADAPIPSLPPDETGAAPTTVRTGMGFAAGSFVVNAVVGLLSAVVTARLYGVTVIGEYALVIAPWVLLIQLSSMSEQKALTRELSSVPPKDPRATGLFLPVLGFSATLSAVVAIPILALTIGALAGPVGQGDLVAPAVLIVVGYVLVENTSWNVDAVLSAFLAGRELFWAKLSQAAAFPVVAVLVRPVSGTVWALTVATLISFVAGFLLRLVLVQRYLSLRPSRVELRAGFRALPGMLGFALRLLPSRIASGVTSQAGVWILGVTSSVQVVGAFARANSVAVRINDAGFRLAEILFPALVKRHQQGDGAGFERLMRDAVRVTGIPLLLGASVAGGVASGLLKVFGDGFDDATNAFALLLFAYTLFVLVVIQSQGVLAIGRPGAASWIGIARAVLTIALMVPFARLWGGTGAALALLVGMALSWQLQARLLRRLVLHTPARPDARFAFGAVASSLAGFGAARATANALAEPWATLAGSVTGALAFAAAAMLTGFIRRDDVARLNRELKRLRRRSASSSAVDAIATPT